MPQRFGFAKTTKRNLLLVSSFFLLLSVSVIVFFLYLLFGWDTFTASFIIYYIFTIALGISPYVVTSLFFLNRLRLLPYHVIMIDNEGIWYEHLGKADGLVTWSRIRCSKDNVLLRQFSLLDDNGNVLLKIDYLLEDINQLRDIIAEKTYANVKTSQRLFAKTIKYQLLLYIGFITAFFVLVLLGDWIIKIIGWFGIAIVVFEYLTSVTKITVADDHFVLSFPFRKTVIPFSDIKTIATTTRRSQESKYFQIGLFVNGRKKPYRLTRLGIDDMALLVILKKAIQKHAAKIAIR